LDVGAVSQEVKVVGGSQLVQTESTSISSTVRVDQISNLPLITRNTLNFVVLLPSVDTASGSHSQRSSTVSGLPQSSISISVDGITSGQDTRSGRILRTSIGLDLIEEVTLSTATVGADASGRGAVQIKFATRSAPTSSSAVVQFHRDRSTTRLHFNNLPERSPEPVELPEAARGVGLYAAAGRHFLLQLRRCGFR
jgi:hypothetical protein